MAFQMNVRLPLISRNSQTRILITTAASALTSNACKYSFSYEYFFLLKFVLSWANVTINQPCVVEQMPYIAFGPNNEEFIYVVSRYVLFFSILIFTSELIFSSVAEIVFPTCIATLHRKFVSNKSSLALPVQQIRSRFVSTRCLIGPKILFSRCESNNCLPNLTCGVSPQAPKRFAIWVYIVVGLGIIGGTYDLYQQKNALDIS